MHRVKNKKVIVAMSGGVDSSVATALLKRAGFEVAGVFMKFWSGDGGNRCCSPESETRARQVAKKLGIPFYVFDFRQEFKKRIVDRFLAECRLGLTPNPCVVCNKEIKFGLLLEKALSLGAAFVATGHYARVQEKGGNIHLLVAKDKEKDQSYFLWQLNQKQLRRILFPLAGYTKTQARKIAKKFGLPVQNIPESQEICFIPSTMNDFLFRHLKQKPGDIVDAGGRLLGQHDGLLLYTIGQRKGIRLAGGPYYVVQKDLKKNRLIVSKNEKDLYKKELRVKKINWVSGAKPKLPLPVRAKIRYGQKAKRAQVRPGGQVVFDRPQRAVTPGQSAVFYRGGELLGGGIIT